MRIELQYYPCRVFADGEDQHEIKAKVDVDIYPADMRDGLDENRLGQACEQFKADLRVIFEAIAKNPRGYRDAIPENRHL